MSDYDKIIYQNTCLKEVIVRLDFQQEYKELSEKLPESITACIKKYFPIQETSKGILQSVKFEPEKVSTSKEEYNQWSFRSKDLSNKLIIEKSAIILSVTNYESFNSMYSQVIDIFAEISKTNPEIQITRLGLRYINHIVLTGDPFDWTDYICNTLLDKFDFSSVGLTPVKLMHNTFLRNDDCLLHFQYGLPNPDFPATMKQRFFVLDYDAYFDGVLQLTDACTYINKLHKSIQVLFESNVTETFKTDVLKYGER